LLHFQNAALVQVFRLDIPYRNCKPGNPRLQGMLYWAMLFAHGDKECTESRKSKAHGQVSFAATAASRPQINVIAAPVSITNPSLSRPKHRVVGSKLFYT
jgi:hypothetical protein